MLAPLGLKETETTATHATKETVVLRMCCVFLFGLIVEAQWCSNKGLTLCQSSYLCLRRVMPRGNVHSWGEMHRGEAIKSEGQLQFKA